MTPKHAVDVAVNIFGKPFQTSLSLLSLLDRSRQHLNKIWLNFEPFGSKFDKLQPYVIHDYLRERCDIPCEASQPDFWLARDTPDQERMADPAYRSAIRYQYAWERSSAPWLFIMHNDVYFIRDLLGAMLGQIGDAAAIAEIGQCWNCPAANAGLAGSICASAPCQRQHYQEFSCTATQLRNLYREAQKSEKFSRPYDAGCIEADFSEQPWPLPECRPNEWACLINLAKTRPITVPNGDVYPYGAFKMCGNAHLDIGVAWFRGIHRHGMACKHINVRDYLKHWVGTGKKSATRYAQAEDNALAILKKRFPDYIEWLEKKAPDAMRS
ncbi:MAG: hypothetical protein HDQ91_05555 [Desulfovibrio sp.]|nr:hypothetical protein [Desulfovibrio sp.]